MFRPCTSAEGYPEWGSTITLKSSNAPIAYGSSGPNENELGKTLSWPPKEPAGFGVVIEPRPMCQRRSGYSQHGPPSLVRVPELPVRAGCPIFVKGLAVSQLTVPIDVEEDNRDHSTQLNWRRCQSTTTGSEVLVDVTKGKGRPCKNISLLALSNPQSVKRSASKCLAVMKLRISKRLVRVRPIAPATDGRIFASKTQHKVERSRL
ncbi:hypothetical protein LIA77_03088 [Sarocladium implicatum]|nr:hypothetical protein LIA77_03088 [Sarocladium implicatum]